MLIVIPVFADVTPLDVIGPYEVLWRMPGADVRLAALEAGPVVAGGGHVVFDVATALADVPHPEVLVVPGGMGARAVAAGPTSHPLLRWIVSAHTTSTWTTSVCTGSLLLARAGVLDGLEATTHWSAMADLAALGAVPVERRVVHAGKVVTAAGVSAGIDFALRLAADLHGDEVAQRIQLGIEYDPEPPFRAGSPRTAPAALVASLRAAMAGTRSGGGAAPGQT